MLALLTLLALPAAADPVSETVRSGSVKDRVVQDDADLVIFYVSEHRGNLGTCGCSVNPRGGLARLGGYLDAVERHGPGTPSLVVHAGWWASDRLSGLDLHPAALVQDRAMVQAAEMVGFDALNLTFRDTPFLRTDPAPEGGVSTNADGLPSIVRTTAGDYSVAILGVSRPGSANIQPDGVSWTDPVKAVQAVLAEVEDADVVVVLAFEVGKHTENLANLGGVTAVIDAGGYPGKLDPQIADSAVWVQAKDQGQAVGELRLWLTEDGEIDAVSDRWVDLDDRVPEDRGVRKLQRQTDRERLKLLGDR